MNLGADFLREHLKEDLRAHHVALAAARRSFRLVRDPTSFTSLLPKDAKPPARIRKD
jgi:hypothetical protein